MIEAPVTAEIQRIRRIALGDYVYRSARRNGAKTAIVDGQTRLSYDELNIESNRFGHYLLETFPVGVHVGMLCANSAEMVVAMQGIHKAGAVWVPVNPMLDGPAIKYILSHAEVGVVVIDEDLFLKDQIAKAIKELDLPVVITRPTAASKELGMATLAEARAGKADALPDVAIDSDQVALIMYTSGTTGNPKGVMHSNASVHAGALANVSSFAFTEKDVVSSVLPLFHVGQHCLLASGLIAGVTFVLTRGFNPTEVAQAIQREKLSVFVGLPMMYAAILNDRASDGIDFSSIRLCVYAMAPMPRSLVDKIAARITSNIALVTGQTEIYPITMAFRPVENPTRSANYWGVSTISCETAVMSDEGDILPPGQVGEIVHRGANAMLGYFKDPDATAVAQRHGWHHTGDLGMFDEGGQLQFLDRKKDMIKTGGENVASIKVETALLEHPEIQTAVVVGLPHPHWSEAIAAFVILKPGSELNEEKLILHCRERLGKFEVPKAIRIVDSLPTTATGKLQKFVMRSEYGDIFSGETESHG